ncbi:BAG family molecular chaperone regulator 1 isoform X1 [Mesocricetus auratus]|uniref:BAG family molecular chaperone regulator 1 n=1 Tax=Mesocricetus auratus TaxID=10036 RepID=A0ABM2WZK5_MESAU|nr:BAG family molecular chaperone regulator 1 isoform X1 [Mesocricetus auratus]
MRESVSPACGVSNDLEIGDERGGDGQDSDIMGRNQEWDGVGIRDGTIGVESSVASGHDRSTGGAAAGACRPRVKKKVRPRSAQSEKVAHSRELTRGKKVTRSKKVAGTQEVPQVEEVIKIEEATQTEEVIMAEEVTQTESLAQIEQMVQTEEMETPGLSVTVTHSNERYELLVTPQQGLSEPVVQDLAQLVEEATGVPIPFQKLIFKGKSLKEMETPLSTLGIQNGCRVMLIGEKSNPEEEVELKKLQDLEVSVEKTATRLEEMNKELSGIQQGFLAKEFQAEALCKLDRKVKATIEQFMKILEEIDTMVLPENFKDSRLKRKNLVKKVQVFLAECDTVEQYICQETQRLQSTNFALAE